MTHDSNHVEIWDKDPDNEHLFVLEDRLYHHHCRRMVLLDQEVQEVQVDPAWETLEVQQRQEDQVGLELDDQGQEVNTVAARELAGQDDLLLRRNSQNGRIECLTNKSAIALNEALHAHN